jgi:hypothetical protein
MALWAAKRISRSRNDGFRATSEGVRVLDKTDAARLTFAGLGSIHSPDIFQIVRCQLPAAKAHEVGIAAFAENHGRITCDFQSQ